METVACVPEIKARSSSVKNFVLKIRAPVERTSLECCSKKLSTSKQGRRGRPRKRKQEWEVERIRSKRSLADGSVEYLVQWVGFPQSENTWEPLESLVKCQNVIDDYEETEQLLAMSDSQANGQYADGHEDIKDELPDLEGCYGSLTKAEETKEDMVKGNLGIKEIPDCKVEFFEDDDRRPARAFLNCRYNDDAQDLYYIVEWADGDDCEEIPGSLAREKYPLLLIQFLSQTYARQMKRNSLQ